ncbi:MAG TPA: hypothetical protein VF002_00020 [Gaiellaceae bacterium]
MRRASADSLSPIPLTQLALLASIVSLAVAAPAQASQLIDRDATNVHLAVNTRGQALLTYRVGGLVRHVLGWGALNARPSGSAGSQASFKLDYSGGWGTYHRVVWRQFKDACGSYDGPKLPALVATCKAPDGSFWAVQSWKVPLPDLGFLPWLLPQKQSWLTLSHWTGPVAQLEVYTNWIYSGRFQQLFGRLTYLGRPVYGSRTSYYGAPKDAFGRLVYLDTLNAPAYGQGWRRENSFVSHKGTGAFCYGFYRFDPSTGGYAAPPGWPRHKLRGPGTGERYRLTVMGPGVTPDIRWEGPGLHRYDPSNPADVAYQAKENAILASFHDRLCRPH